jgi:hypothetical protein
MIIVGRDWNLYDISQAVRQNSVCWCGRRLEKHVAYRESPKTCLVGMLLLLWYQRHRGIARRVAYWEESQYNETDPHRRWEDSRSDAQKRVANAVCVETPLAVGRHASARRAHTYCKPVIVLDKASTRSFNAPISRDSA